MNREYIGYVKDACQNGMNPDEVQYLFNDIMTKTNTRKGKKVLKLFAQGIGKAKKRVMVNKTNMNPTINQNQPQQVTIVLPQMQKTIGTFKQ